MNICSSKWIVGIKVYLNFAWYLKFLSQSLQGPARDVMTAYSKVTDCYKCIRTHQRHAARSWDAAKMVEDILRAQTTKTLCSTDFLESLWKGNTGGIYKNCFHPVLGSLYLRNEVSIHNNKQDDIEIFWYHSIWPEVTGRGTWNWKIQKNWCTVTVVPTLKHHGGHSQTPANQRWDQEMIFQVRNPSNSSNYEKENGQTYKKGTRCQMILNPYYYASIFLFILIEQLYWDYC